MIRTIFWIILTKFGYFLEKIKHFWTILDNFGQLYASLDNFRKVWSHLDIFKSLFIFWLLMKIGNGFISKIKLEYELKLQNCRNAFKTGSSWKMYTTLIWRACYAWAHILSGYKQINQGIKGGESQGYISICNTITTGYIQIHSK